VFYVLGVFVRSPIDGFVCLHTFSHFIFIFFLYSFQLLWVSVLQALNLCYSNRVCLKIWYYTPNIKIFVLYIYGSNTLRPVTVFYMAGTCLPFLACDS